MPRKPPGYKDPGSVGDPMRKPPTVDHSTFQVVSTFVRDKVFDPSPANKPPGKIAKATQEQRQPRCEGEAQEGLRWVDIDWAAVGSVLAGIGSLLSGLVALRLARKIDVKLEARDEAAHRDDPGPDAGGG